MNATRRPEFESCTKELRSAIYQDCPAILVTAKIKFKPGVDLANLGFDPISELGLLPSDRVSRKEVTCKVSPSGSTMHWQAIDVIVSDPDKIKAK